VTLTRALLCPCTQTDNTLKLKRLKIPADKRAYFSNLAHNFFTCQGWDWGLGKWSPAGTVVFMGFQVLCKEVTNRLSGSICSLLCWLQRTLRRCAQLRLTTMTAGFRFQHTYWTIWKSTLVASIGALSLHCKYNFGGMTNYHIESHLTKSD